ncbi:Cilia- and flagella-associated protein 58 like protein [Argiope bruennichi]|uniref:Cilia- and flagella-associated protein 58 like protein n=1 Tax=Argiope bruennichi TaxID=94029 RepID=A0A8T0EQG0_ARGBR|nr:Cilia- and flagella-associated protein 58 like protein [Argiope bruennichi]
MEETDREISNFNEIPSSNVKDIAYESSDNNPAPTENSKGLPTVRKDADLNERQRTFDESKTKWLEEAKNFSDSESCFWSEVQYVNQCEEMNNCLDNLLSNGMTTVYVSVSKLFKSFRSVFAGNQKLKNKVFELVSETRSIQKRNEHLEERISEKEERIQNLERLVDSDINRIQMIERTKFELESQLEDSQRKCKEIEEKSQAKKEDPRKEREILFEKYSGALKEIDILNLKLTASRIESERLEAERERSQTAQNELQDEIRSLRTKVETLSRQRDEAHIGFLSRNKEAQRQLDLTESLKREIQSLKVELDATRNKSKILMNDLKSCENKLREATRHCNLLNKNLAARQFHLTVLKTQKEKLEEAVKEKKDEAESLKTMRRRNAAMKTQETVYYDIKKEIGSFHRQSQELQKKIRFLEDEKQKMLIEISQMTQVHSDIQNQLQLLKQNGIAKDQEISRLKEEIEKLKERNRFHSNNEYDARKQLQKTKEKLKEALHIQHHFTDNIQQQIDQIRNFEDRVQTLQKQVIALKVTNNDIKCTLKQLERQNGELTAEVECKDRDYKSTLQLLEKTEHELKVSKEKIKSLLSEKSAAELKITENHKELTKKNELAESLADGLAKLKNILKDKESEIKICRVELESLKRSLSVTRKQLQEKESIQKQLVKVQNLFDGERLKCKVLEEELQKSRNVHRWRFLEGTDTPIQYLMLKSVHLQKMLTRKSNLLSRKENELKNKDKLIEELTANKMKGSELDAQKELWSCQKELSKCKNEIKCLLEIAAGHELPSGDDKQKQEGMLRTSRLWPFFHSSSIKRWMGKNR